MSQLVAEFILSPIGATIRWAWGNTWRSIAGKKKFTFKEYLNGPKDGEPFIDTVVHEFNNLLIGGIVLVSLGLLLTFF